jgi:hypothetical protein
MTTYLKSLRETAERATKNWRAYVNVTPDGAFYLASGNTDNAIALFDPETAHRMLAVIEAAEAAVANDREWERFDYKTFESVPESCEVHTERMEKALAALREHLGETK